MKKATKTSEGTNHPIQPMVLDVDGRARFKQNPIVRTLLDDGPYNLDKLMTGVVNGQFSEGDFEQLMQLLGYSLGGFGEVWCATDRVYDHAELEAQKLLDAQAQKPSSTSPDECIVAARQLLLNHHPVELCLNGIWLRVYNLEALESLIVGNISGFRVAKHV